MTVIVTKPQFNVRDELNSLKGQHKNAWGPAFSARRTTSQTISSNVWTKAALDTKDFDTAMCYDASTYRFTPNLAGLYQVNGASFLGVNGNAIGIYKNGNEYKTTGWGGGQTNNISCLVYLNGSSDFIELYIYGTTTSTIVTSYAYFFDAHFVRGA